MIFTRDQCRAVDRRAVQDYGMSSLVLMENAGRGVADVLCALGIDGLVAVCCGPGNNGGDGLVLARHLDLRGVAVKVLLWADGRNAAGRPAGLSPDAAANERILRCAGVPIVDFDRRTAGDAPGDAHDALETALADAVWIVDALVGTGARGDPRPPLDVVIRRINEHPASKLAVDIPSGLDCDTGRPGEPTVRAAHTCTFVAAKAGFSKPGASQFTGTVHVLDIGVPRRLIHQIAGA
jgi:NAD(P)H-hydrate epimerase